MNRFTKTIGGTVVVLTLGFGGLAMAAPAIADEAAPVETTQEVVVSPSTEATAPSTPLAEVSVPSEPSSASSLESPEPIPSSTVPTEKKVETLVTKELHWLTPNTGDVPPTSETVGWPQFSVDPATCGTGWFQNDINRYGTDAEKASVDAQDDDGILTKGEDYGTIVSWTYTHQTACPPPVVQKCTAFGTVTYTATDENGTLPATINTSDTRTAGHNQIVNNALHTWTTEATSKGKAAGYFATPGLTLGTVGTPGFEFSASSGVAPGFQIVLPSGRILINESNYYGDRFWSKTAQAGVPSNDGYPASANLKTWFAALGNIAIPYEGYSVGSGVVGDSTIVKITNGNGCDIVFKDYVKPVVIPEQPKPTVTTREISTDTLDCTAQSITTVTQHYSTTTTFVYDDETNDYHAVVGDEVRGKDTSATSESSVEECPVVVVVNPPTTDTALVVQKADLPNALAFTGTNAVPLGIVAFSVFASGVIIVWSSRRRIKNSEKD